jgi:ubiquinone/menaquinone biosynthesis C-methylase UbiE
MQRREIILKEELTPTPGQMVLVNRDGLFERLGASEVAQPGQVVVVYDIDLKNEDDLTAANKLFSGDYYTHIRRGPYPDEMKVIEEFVPESGATVLEACCGAGRVAPALIRGGNQVTAIDNSEECIRRAIEVESKRDNRPAVSYQVADVLHLPFADKSFDIVSVMGNSLAGLFSKRRQMLSELVRVCRQRVILGLREVAEADDEVLIYSSQGGFFEFSLSHSLQTFRPFLDVFPKPPHYRHGDRRPYGGKVWFLVFDL